MKVNTNVAIIGAGLSGLIIHHELKKDSVDSVIFERGYSHGFTGDYVIFAKQKFDYAQDKIDIKILRLSSGSSNEFQKEYQQKLYNDRKNITLFSGNKSEETEGYRISTQFLLKHAYIYGNIAITNIDINKKKIYGYILHIKEEVEISYKYLISTIPIYKFAKLIGMDLFNEYGIFISYFPVGIKKIYSKSKFEDMFIEYYSDPNIPFYRKQYIGNSIYYEYCLNKPIDEKFDNIIIPGKFLEINDQKMSHLHDDLRSKSIYLIGRFATWDPNFLLDHITICKKNNDITSPFNESIKNLYEDLS